MTLRAWSNAKFRASPGWLDFVVYVQMWWRPKRIAGECSTAPCFVPPLIFLTLMGVVMRQCSPGKTMEAPLQADFTGGTAQLILLQCPFTVDPVCVSTGTKLDSQS